MTFRDEMVEFVKRNNFSDKLYVEYIKREEACFNTPEKMEFFQKTKDIVEFVKKDNIEIGFLRGGASSCLFLCL